MRGIQFLNLPDIVVFQLWWKSSKFRRRRFEPVEKGTVMNNEPTSRIASGELFQFPVIEQNLTLVGLVVVRLEVNALI
jgi:hypothetical protein